MEKKLAPGLWHVYLQTFWHKSNLEGQHVQYEKVQRANNATWKSATCKDCNTKNQHRNGSAWKMCNMKKYKLPESNMEKNWTRMVQSSV